MERKFEFSSYFFYSDDFYLNERKLFCSSGILAEFFCCIFSVFRLQIEEPLKRKLEMLPFVDRAFVHPDYECDFYE